MAEYQIFDDESTPRSYTEIMAKTRDPSTHLYDFINSIPQPFGKRVRATIEMWGRHIPSWNSETKDTVRRLRYPSADLKYWQADQQFRSLFWEFFVHEVFHRFGFAIKSEVSGYAPQKNTTVDFECSIDGDVKLLVECLNLSTPQEISNADKLIQQYTELLKSHFIDEDASIFMIGQATDKFPPDEDIISAISNHLPVGELMKLKIPETQEGQSLTIILEPATKTPHIEVSLIRTWTPSPMNLTRKFQEKTRQKVAPDIAVPFLLAVTTDNPAGSLDNELILSQCFYSNDETSLFSDYSQVSGILVGTPFPWELDPTDWNVATTPLTLYPNPSANNPISLDLGEIPWQTAEISDTSEVGFPLRYLPRTSDIYSWFGIDREAWKTEKEEFQSERRSHWSSE